jgi:hypothetical protein
MPGLVRPLPVLPESEYFMVLSMSFLFIVCQGRAQNALTRMELQLGYLVT